jgi:DNA-binding NtrC family response regulator
MATTYPTSLEAHRVSDLVLLISPDAEDAVFMREIASSLGCRLESASDWHEAELALQRDVFRVVIAERDLHDGNWRDVLSCLERYSYNPLLVVVSRLADERLWAEVLNLGGFDVLAKPFAQEEANRVIDYALISWKQRSERERRASIRDSEARRLPVGSHRRGLAAHGT